MRPNHIIFFDTETTGVDVHKDRVVEIAWLLTTAAGEIILEDSRIIKPSGFEIPAESEAIHGISTELATNEGEDLSKVLSDFFSDMEDADLLVGHNLQYDRNIIRSECLRAKINSNQLSKPQFCTMVNSTTFCQLSRGFGRGFKFPKLAEAYKIIARADLIDCHDALVDTEACKEIFFSGIDQGIWRYADEDSICTMEVLR